MRRLSERGIRLTNTSDALFDDVADMALLLLLAARRNLIRAHDYVRSGDWGRQGMFPLQSAVRGKRLGIVGHGPDRAGHRHAGRGGGAGDRLFQPQREARGGACRSSPICWRWPAWADILIVIVAGGPATIGADRRRGDPRARAAGTLVNVAAGRWWTSRADRRAARWRPRLGRAGCLSANEPNPDPVLTGLPNVTLYPHHASGTEETRDAMSQTVVDNLAAYFAGRPLLTPVN